jgi:hypothetical protein
MNLTILRIFRAPQISFTTRLRVVIDRLADKLPIQSKDLLDTF